MTPNGRKAARPFTARSLVGMTMGARKRAARNSVKRSGLKPYMLYEEYRIGERLRPCPGCLRCRSCSGCEVLEFEGERCARCGKECPSEPTQCDGSGVLPARKQK